MGKADQSGNIVDKYNMAENTFAGTSAEMKTSLATGNGDKQQVSKKKSFNNRKKFNSTQNSYSKKQLHKKNQGKSSTFDYDGYEDDLIQQQILASQIGSRNKKGQISINHLLDFSLPEREPVANPHRGPKGQRKYQKYSQKSSLHLAGKAFINANYRFIADYHGNYGQQKIDPNIPLENHDILRVIIRNANACPICLEEGEGTVAPRMVSCGHCFCYTCLLQYLDTDNDKEKKEAAVKGATYKKKKKECPLCAMKIDPEEIFPVLYDSSSFDEKFETPKVNEDAIFKLMVKPHDSVLALPVANNPDFAKLGDFPLCCEEDGDRNLNKDVFPYARIMKGNLDFVISQYQKDINEINKTFTNDEAMFGSSTEKYVKQAIRLIDNKILSLKNSFGQSETYKPENTDFNENLMEKLTINDDNKGHDVMNTYNANNAYFYYQTNFGATIKYLLSALDVKILKAIFHDYNCFPSTLVLPVENILYGEVLTEKNVSRYKYVAHFPFGTELAFLEINWLLGKKDTTSFRLPDNVYSMFKKEIQNRSRVNKRRLQTEEHNRKVALRNLELKTKEFYQRENEAYLYPHGQSEQRNYDYYEPEPYVPIDGNPDDFFPLPNETATNNPLADDKQNPANETEPPADYTTTVWGTKIRKSTLEDLNDDDDYDDTGIDTEELLRQVQAQKDANTGKGKKKKGKRLVLVSSSTRGG